jgi:hypothetical protein
MEDIMLRALARTLAVLVAAAAVAGVLYFAFAPDGSAASRPGFTGRDPASFDGHFGGRRGRGDGQSMERGQRHGREEASLGRGIAGAGMTAIQLGCVGAVVVGLQKGWRRRQR